MVDFVLEQERLWHEEGMFNTDVLDNVMNYANFLKKPLTKGMFIPCDLEGNVLEYNKNHYEEFCDKEAVCRVFSEKEVEYEQAKERVLFAEFEFSRENDHYVFLKREGIYTHLISKIYKETVQDMAKYDFKLTATAIKQLGL